MSKALDMARELVKKLEEEEKQSKVQLSTLNPGDVFKIGEHDFIVLMQCREETAVISKGFMAENVKFDEDSRNYKESNLKKVIENQIQPVIEVEVGSKNLIEHEVDLTSVDMQDEFGGFKCKVRPITFDEARLYNNLLVNKNINDCWWTCTPWSTEDRGWKYSITVVAPTGDFSNCDCYCNYGGVRTFCILKSNIFVSKGE